MSTAATPRTLRPDWPYWPLVPWVFWAGLLLVLLLTTGPLAQDPAYHRFADMRGWLGIPHFGDVASNAAISLAGLAGLWALWRRAGADRVLLGVPRLPVALLFFASVALTGVGSAYYHWAPDSLRLVWDRLPIGLVAAAFPVLVLVERAVVTPLGLRALWLWLALGPLAVGYWHYTEGLGRGDLRPYLLVQAVALLGATLLPWLLPARHTPNRAYYGAVLCYLLAATFEHTDRAVFEALGIVSGHTLKHLLAAAAVGLVAWGWGRRSATSAAPRA